MKNQFFAFPTTYNRLYFNIIIFHGKAGQLCLQLHEIFGRSHLPQQHNETSISSCRSQVTWCNKLIELQQYTTPKVRAMVVVSYPCTARPLYVIYVLWQVMGPDVEWCVLQLHKLCLSLSTLGRLCTLWAACCHSSSLHCWSLSRLFALRLNANVVAIWTLTLTE